MTLEVEGLVVGGVDYGDADRILHLLTRDGRRSLFAHGARRSRRRFAGVLDPFTSIRATLEPRRREGLATIASAVVLDARLPLREDLAKIALASYVVELGARVAPEGEAADLLYFLVLAVLGWLGGNPASVAARRAYELKLIALLGYRPELAGCLECGAPGSHLDLVRGGALCEAHAGGARAIGPNTRAWLAATLGAVAPTVPAVPTVGAVSAAPGTGGEPAFAPDGGLEPTAADVVARKLAAPFAAFFASLLETPLRSTRLLDDLAL